MCIETDGVMKLRNSDTFRIFFPDQRYISRPVLTSESVFVQISSAAVSIEDMILERFEMTEDAGIIEWMEGLPPEKLLLAEEPMIRKEDTDTIALLLKSVISCRLDRTASGRMKCLALWYEMIAAFDFAIRSRIYERFGQDRRKLSSNYYHVYRIKKYIFAHLSEPLSVESISGAVGLSPDYIGRIFRQECGMNLTSYLAQCRTEKIRQLISERPTVPLSEIAAEAGFSDLRYAQRMFKKYTGITMQRCRQLGNGLTLWHNNPWEYDNLDHDIYTPGEENAAVGKEKAFDLPSPKPDRDKSSHEKT